MPKIDVKLLNTHAYDEDVIEKAKLNVHGYINFTLNIYKWIYRSNKKGLKKQMSVVKIYAPIIDVESIEKVADDIVHQLNNGTYIGNKNIRVK